MRLSHGYLAIAGPADLPARRQVRGRPGRACGSLVTREPGMGSSSSVRGQGECCNRLQGENTLEVLRSWGSRAPGANGLPPERRQDDYPACYPRRQHKLANEGEAPRVICKDFLIHRTQRALNHAPRTTSTTTSITLYYCCKLFVHRRGPAFGKESRAGRDRLYTLAGRSDRIQAKAKDGWKGENEM